MVKYDVSLNGEIKCSNLDVKKCNIKGLESYTEYRVSVIAKDGDKDVS